MTDIRESVTADVRNSLLDKEWDEVSCPICIEHPHNAVLLLCSSHEKGCKTYICDTSYRHSNCLDRFRKIKVNHRESSQYDSELLQNLAIVRHGHRALQPLATGPARDVQRMELAVVNGASHLEGQAYARHITQSGEDNPSQERIDQQQSGGGDLAVSEHEGILKCPLCRGSVLGYKIVKEARQNLDLKLRSCSWETCTFRGNYRALRRHARQAHPAKRPADVDPSRLRAWCHMENDWAFGDVLSALQSTSPNAIVIGDYVIDGSSGVSNDWENGRLGDNRSWRTTLDLELNQLIHGPISLRRGLSRSWRTNQRPGQQFLWGTNLLGLQDEEGHNEFPGGNVFLMQQRTPRWRTRLRSLWGENLVNVQDDNHEESQDADEVQAPQRHHRFVRPRHNANSHER